MSRGKKHFARENILRRMRARRMARSGGSGRDKSDRWLNALIGFSIFLLLILVIFIAVWLFG